MVGALHHRFTFEEYVSLEQDSGTKHEYLDGQVWAMAGGTPDHAAIAGNILTMLNVQLAGRKCRVFTSDLRVRSKATGLGTYPDVSVACGRLERDPEDRTGNTVVNPRVIVEVLSPSTEVYDRGEKLGHYQRIATLYEIVLVAHDRHEIEVVRRTADDSWTRHVFIGGDSAFLSSLSCVLSLAEVYRDPLAT